MTFSNGWLNFECAPHHLSGVVYGTLLNHWPGWEALGKHMQQAPYKAAPQAPVLYVKPRNTLSRHGDAVTVPADAPAVQVGATLGIVIGRTACCLTPDNALDHVAGYTVVNDVSVPHDSFYRPSVRFKARDGFCPIGPTVVPRDALSDPNALNVQVWVDGELHQTTTTGNRVRNVSRLLADVTDFMTLQPGDVLMLGVSAGAPLVHAGQTVAIEIEGVGRLVNRFTADTLASGAAA